MTFEVPRNYNPFVVAVFFFSFFSFLKFIDAQLRRRTQEFNYVKESQMGESHTSSKWDFHSSPDAFNTEVLPLWMMGIENIEISLCEILIGEKF